MKYFCSNCGLVNDPEKCSYCDNEVIEVVEEKPKVKVFKGPTKLSDFEDAGG